MISDAQRLEWQWEGFWRAPNLGAPLWDSIKNFHPPEKREYSWVGDLGNIPLGKRAEKFFESGIKSADQYKLIAKNIQIIQSGITMGEIDFVLFDRERDSYVHVELAFKLYLLDPDSGKGLDRWIGPNRRDRLVDKLHKLKTQQFPKLFDSIIAEIFSEKSINTSEVEQRLYLPGQLFVPHGSNVQISTLNPDAVAGVYMGFSDFKLLAAEVKCWIPEKQDWFIDPSRWPTWISGSDAISQVKEKLSRSRSPMVWIKDRDRNYSRCFVVFWKA